MQTSQDNTSLLGIIKRLYSRIMELQNQSRARYSLTAGNNISPKNIARPLSVCIDKLAERSATKSLDSVATSTHESGISTHNYKTITRDPDSMKELGELSVHLKDAHKYTGISQDTGAKLVQTTWEHFHTTIRLARQGNAKAARIHMDLTNNALIEAAHYLSESDYDHFSKEVIQAIEEINNHI